MRFHFDITDSTNARARELAAAHPGRTLVVSAGEQTAGRGRHGRSWSSPAGGAWFSLAIPMAGAPTRYAPAPLAVGLAVIRVLEDRLSGDAVAQLEIKWPNDVLLNGAKVCGILCEQLLPPPEAPPPPEVPPEVIPELPRSASSPARATLIVGVGINVNLTEADLPADARYPATSVQTVAGRAMDLVQLIDQCAQAIAHEIAQLNEAGLNDEQFRRLNANLAWRHQRVTLTPPGSTAPGSGSTESTTTGSSTSILGSNAAARPASPAHTGTLQGIDHAGSALVKVPSQPHPIPCTLGDLQLRRAPQ